MLQHKPALTTKHKADRVAFAEAHAHEAWPVWVFTDEYTININGTGSTSRASFSLRIFCLYGVSEVIWYAHSRDEVPNIETTKYAPSFHVFAAITRERTLPLRFFEGKLNSVNYTQILDNFFKDVANVRKGVQCIFQHDGSPYHTSRYALCTFVLGHAVAAPLSVLAQRQPGIYL